MRVNREEDLVCFSTLGEKNEIPKKNLGNKLKQIIRKLKIEIPNAKLKTEEDVVAILSDITDSILVERKRIQEEKKASNARLNEILKVIQSFANLDYSKRIRINQNGDYYDALGSGINMLGEELKTTTISLKEKEILLKEIHHRVKNNLQIISSLLNIQAGYIKNKEAIVKFKDTQSRVISMALFHEKLYKSKDFSQIDFSEYIAELVDWLFKNYCIDPELIILEQKVNIKRDDFDIDLALNCSLILNELISNSLKYAFPDSRNGKVLVKFIKLNNKNKKAYRLSVSDDGIGIPLDFEIMNSPTLGFQLVETMVEQINGNIKIERKKGTCIIIDFEIK